MKDDLISRQAVLDWLEDEWDGMVVHVFDGIKNIPSAHCDNCPYPDQHVPQEDAVSRKELKHIFETWLTVSGYNDSERNMIKAVLYELQFAPSVMPVQRSFSCGQDNDLISRQAAIDALGEEPYVWAEDDEFERGMRFQWKSDHDAIEALPSAQPEPCEDAISRQDAIGEVVAWLKDRMSDKKNGKPLTERLKALPSAQPEQRYTEEELSVFKHGISLSLLSKRSAQYWHYDADTAIEIEFLERLYDKVSADMKGEQG